MAPPPSDKTFLVCHGAWSGGWSWKKMFPLMQANLPRSYIYATRITPADTFGQFAARAKSESGWRYFEIDASHSPNVTAPDALVRVLKEIVT
jgi:hypothetical protein